MTNNILEQLYDIINDKKTNPTKESYTCYLFEQGTDKILKKVGEESTELVIAAKNKNKVDIVNETADLFYHVCVLLSEQNVKITDVFSELETRAEKIGNLKIMRKTDKAT